MLRFFAPVVPGRERRSIVAVNEWRDVIALMSIISGTPLPSMLAMPWDEALRWYPALAEAWKATKAAAA